MLRLALLTVLSLSLLSVLSITAVRPEDVSAGSDVSFAIGINADGDADNDCGTGVPTAVGNGAPDPVPAQVSNTTCVVGEGRTFRANVYLMDNGGNSFVAAATHVTYSGVTTDERGTSSWDACEFEASAGGAGYENVACVVGVPPAGPVQVVGLLAQFTFVCTADGTMALGHAIQETAIYTEQQAELGEAGPDALTIDCQEGIGELAGDSDCNGTINSIDAALILQNSAGLFQNLPCAQGADANGNGTIDSIDAALVLQYSAGLIDEL
jgi:hypothetical protein